MTKGTYVDGFVFVVSKKNLTAYKKMAKEGAATWKKFGVLEYKECMGQDLKNNGGSMNFPKLAKVKSGETVWFSYIVFKNKKHRDTVNKKVMAYFSKKYTDQTMAAMPFDMNRMAYGGFSVIVG